MQPRHVYERLKPVIEIVRRVAGHDQHADDQRQRADGGRADDDDDVHHEAEHAVEGEGAL